MKNVKVLNIIGSNGNPAANQFHIEIEDTKAFQSYNSLIAIYEGGTLTLGRDWDYSRTTTKYLSIWMNENTYHIYSQLDGKGSFSKQVQKLIDAGIITYDKEVR